MEGLIPFVIDVIRRSHGRGGSGYRSVSSDGGSSRGGGSRRHLIDYSELPDAAAASAASVGAADWPSSGTVHRRAVPDVGRRNEEHAGPAYRRK